jgi:hypothetical protein
MIPKGGNLSSNFFPEDGGNRFSQNRDNRCEMTRYHKLRKISQEIPHLS